MPIVSCGRAVAGGSLTSVAQALPESYPRVQATCVLLSVSFLFK